MIGSKMRRLGAVAGGLALLGTVAVLPRADAYIGDGAGFARVSCKLGDNPMPGSGDVHEVGAGKTHGTIQAAVDAAAENDTILVHPGTYREAVVVSTDGLRIRGTDRDTVILDGDKQTDADPLKTQRHGDGITVVADRVVIENMTGTGYSDTAFYWFGVTGYWGRNLTAYNNGLYGVYALDSRCGQFNDSYGSGNADSAFYIGECYFCDAVIHDIVAEANAIGYSGTNAGGNLTLRDSLWVGNGLGIVPNSLDGEERPPQRGVTIKDNLVLENNGIDTPAKGIAANFWGIGIAVAGGKQNHIWNNVVSNHVMAGIVLAPLPDQTVWINSGNTVEGNTVGHNADDPRFTATTFDLAAGASSGSGNCFSGNEPGPGQVMAEGMPGLQTVWSCRLPETPPGGNPLVEAELAAGVAGLNGRAPKPWQTWPVPAALDYFTGGAVANLGDADCDVSGSCSVDVWLPALGL